MIPVPAAAAKSIKNAAPETPDFNDSSIENYESSNKHRIFYYFAQMK